MTSDRQNPFGSFIHTTVVREEIWLSDAQDLDPPTSPAISEICFVGQGPRQAACAPPISADGCARPIATLRDIAALAWIFLNNMHDLTLRSP